MLYAHLSALRELNDRLEATANRLRNCADAFNGPQPEAAEDMTPVPVHHALNPQFHDLISQAHKTLSYIQSQINRIEDEVIDGPKAGTVARSL